MINISLMLFQLFGDKRVYDPEFDLVESGLMDSLGLIQLLEKLEDEGIELAPTRIDRSLLRTPGGIQQLVEEHR